MPAVAGVAEWQTQGTQNPPPSRVCGFDSRLRHHHIVSVPSLSRGRESSSRVAALRVLVARLRELFWWLPFGRVPEVEAAELELQLRNGGAPQVVDVRTGIEWREGHIRGARHVPLAHLKRDLPRLALDRERPVVAVCLTAHRSVPAVRLLASRGFRAVQLAGGMRAWRAHGLPTTRDGAGPGPASR